MMGNMYTHTTFSVYLGFLFLLLLVSNLHVPSFQSSQFSLVFFFSTVYFIFTLLLFPCCFYFLSVSQTLGSLCFQRNYRFPICFFLSLQWSYFTVLLSSRCSLVYWFSYFCRFPSFQHSQDPSFLVLLVFSSSNFSVFLCSCSVFCFSVLLGFQFTCVPLAFTVFIFKALPIFICFHNSLVFSFQEFFHLVSFVSTCHFLPFPKMIFIICCILTEESLPKNVL